VDRPYIGCYARTLRCMIFPAVKIRITDYMRVTVRIHTAGRSFHLQDEENRIEGVGGCEQVVKRGGAQRTRASALSRPAGRPQPALLA
jgi:hypothetical protein